MSEVIKIIVQPIVQTVKITAQPGYAVTPDQIAEWNGKQDALSPEQLLTPEQVAEWNGKQDALSPAQIAIWNGKQDALAYTPEDVANKDTDPTLAANSDSKYASQKATKSFVENKKDAS